MAKAHASREIEIKLRIPQLRALQGELKRLRAREIRPRTHELNTLYDTPAQDLRRCGELLRIRTEHVAVSRKKPSSKHTLDADRTILTFKAPVRSAPSKRAGRTKASSGSRFKINEEDEVSFTGADEMNRILRGLGLLPQFRYEKYRTTYVLPSVREVKIELDETPIGNYLELEGSPRGIDRAASLLGHAPSDYIKATYGGLYLADCRRRRRKAGDMLFPK